MKTVHLIILVSVFLFVSFFGNAQQTFDSRLLTKYDKSSLDKMQQDNPEQINFLNYYVEHAGYIVDMPEKPIDYVDLVRLSNNSKAITLTELDNFNPYLYNCKNLPDKNSYYRIGNTGKLLIMVAMKNLQTQYNNQKRIKTINN